MVERVVVASLEKLLPFNKGKEHVVVEDEQNKGESKRKEQADEIWQDEEFFAKKEAEVGTVWGVPICTTVLQCKLLLARGRGVHGLGRASWHGRASSQVVFLREAEACTAKGMPPSTGVLT
ncbi:hypothetical protein JCGZ_00526 [Jatropha curcas]|uniref:Uncharacterized protein n=1 Tax=Jatropha curcas TaxID=180498 RepID=A0A067JSY0_JATCU|nr:hypothetical protein JCGZ_00526 [Jatropha curcas]